MTTETRSTYWLDGVLDAIALCFRRWKILAAFTLVPAAIGVVLALTMQRTWRSQTLVLLVGQQSGGGLSSLVSSMAGKDIADLLGGGSSDDGGDLLEMLLDSRVLAISMMDRYGLDSSWSDADADEKHEVRTPEDRVWAWGGHFRWETTDQGGYLLSMEDKDALRTAVVLQGAVSWLDSAFQEERRGQTRPMLKFIEEMALRRKTLLAQAEDSLLAFQLRTKMIHPTSQIQNSVGAAVDLDAQRLKATLEAQLAEIQEGRASSRAQQARSLEGLLERSVKDILESNTPSPGMISNLRPGVRSALAFERLRRDVELHAAVYKLLVQQSEQLSLEASKSVPVLRVIERAQIPQKHFKPPRRLIVQAFGALGLLLGLTVVLVGRQLQNVYGTGNLYRLIRDRIRHDA